MCDTMNRGEFAEYLIGCIKDYLPEPYQDADVFYCQAKNEDAKLYISCDDDTVTPLAFLEDYYGRYEAGDSEEKILKELIDWRFSEGKTVMDRVMPHLCDYSVVRNKLQIRLVDTELYGGVPDNKVYTEEGVFFAIYFVEDEEERFSAAVTPQLVEQWGISLDTLKMDAMASDEHRGPVFIDRDRIIQQMFTGITENLFELEKPDETMKLPYCLTNSSGSMGASLIIHQNILDRISGIVGEDFLFCLHHVMSV